MTFTGICPRCATSIPKDRFATGYAICECGWTDQAPVAQSRKQSEKIVIAIMSFAAVTMVVGFAHLMSWGSYATTIPVVKIQQWTGTLSNQGFEELAQACISLNKWACAKNAYIGLYRQTNDPTALGQLAHLENLLRDPEQAKQSYEAYVKAGGKDGELFLEYGKLLEDSNQIEESMKMYEASITARPDQLPIRATTAIVRQLMKQGKYEEAFDRVSAFQASAGNAKGYLNTELAQLETYLGPHKNHKTAGLKNVKRRSASVEKSAAKVARF